MRLWFAGERPPAFTADATFSPRLWFEVRPPALGLSLVLLGRPREGIAPLERALAIRDQNEQLPLPRAETRFALARALWDADLDRTRAVALAEGARAELRRAPAATRQAAEVDGWLAVRAGVTARR